MLCCVMLDGWQIRRTRVKIQTLYHNECMNIVSG